MTAPLRVVLVEPDNYSVQARRLLESLGSVVEGPFDRAQLVETARTADVLVVRLAHQIDRVLMDAAPQLRAVVSATTGLNHIDVEAAADRGIAVLSLKGELDFLRQIRATVEHTIALMLAVLRRLPAATSHVEAGGWDRDPYRGQELARRSLGLVGCGRIGTEVARLADAFGMEVAAFDPYAEPWGERPERIPTLEALLRRSHVVSLHVPLNTETTAMIGATELAWMPPGAVLINTSRGEVVDEVALLDALKTGALGGAGLDVLANEAHLLRGDGRPLVDYAKDHDTLLITPHIGGATFESMEQTEVFMAEKLLNWLETGASTPPGEPV